jgi:hypothetical protein
MPKEQDARGGGGTSPGKMLNYKPTWCGDDIVIPNFIYVWCGGRGTQCLPPCTIYRLLGYWGMTVILFGGKKRKSLQKQKKNTVLAHMLSRYRAIPT